MNAVVSKLHKKYIRIQERLVQQRRRSKKVRSNLISAILCDDKEVLTQADIQSIRMKYHQFLSIQKQLEELWSESCKCFRKITAAMD